MPDAPLPPLPPAGRARWRTVIDQITARVGASRVVLVGGGLVVVTVVAAIVVAVVIVGGHTKSPPPVAGAPAAAEPARPETTTTSVTRVVVDVAGAVVRPGLLRLAGGSRVADAIAAAGGPTSEADLRAVNQARVLSDGEQVLVPRKGEVVPTPSPTPAKPVGPLDLNRATVAELDALPGVGPSTAAAIVEWRSRNGRFKRIEDLLEVPGIGPAKLERLRPMVKV